MKVLKKLWVMALAVAPLLASPVGADDRIAEAREGNFQGVSLGPRGSYVDPKGGDGDFFGGLQMRWYPTRGIGFEGSIDARKNSFGQADVITYPVQASLLAFLVDDKNTKPFLLAGAGWYFTTIEVPGSADTTDDRFGLHAGAGVQHMFNGYWSVDGTFRYIWLEEVKSGGAALVNKEYDDSGPMYTLGLNYHF